MSDASVLGIDCSGQLWTVCCWYCAEPTVREGPACGTEEDDLTVWSTWSPQTGPVHRCYV